MYDETLHKSIAFYVPCCQCSFKMAGNVFAICKQISVCGSSLQLCQPKKQTLKTTKNHHQYLMTFANWQILEIWVIGTSIARFCVAHALIVNMYCHFHRVTMTQARPQHNAIKVPLSIIALQSADAVRSSELPNSWASSQKKGRLVLANTLHTLDIDYEHVSYLLHRIFDIDVHARIMRED